MAEPANLRNIRVQYLYVDNAPANLRDVRTEYLTVDSRPTNLRRVFGQMLTVDKSPLNVRAARADYLEAVRTPGTVRRVFGQMVLLEKDPINVRNIRLQYLEKVRTLPNFTLAPWPLLLEAINQNNGTDYQVGDLIPGTPEDSGLPNLQNTRLRVTATPHIGLSGSVDVFYQRFPIETPFVSRNDHPVFDLSDKTSVGDILPELNAWFKLNLTLDEVYDHPIEGNDFVLEVKDTSWFFIPGSIYEFNNIKDMRTLYPVTELDGFDIYTPGSILVEPGAPSGVYKMAAEDNSLFDVYVDMETDGGGWVLVGDWNSSPVSGDTLTFNESIVKDQPIAGISSDPTKPAITAGKFSKNFAKEWMLTSEHPTWQSYFGAWSVGQIFTGSFIPLSGFQVRTPLGNKTMYGSRAGWNQNTPHTLSVGFWTHGNNSGPCGGANRVGPTKCCPAFDSGGSTSHVDYTTKKRLYIRAKNFGQ